MGLQKDRNRIFCRGLGSFYVRTLEPSADASFGNAGFFKSAVVNNTVEMTEIFNDLGQLVNTLQQKQTVDIVTELLQTGKEELDLLLGTVNQVHAARLYGMTANNVFQYFCIPKGRITPNISVNYQPGERTLPLRIVSVFQDEGYTIPLLYFFEGAAELTLDHCVLWSDPALGKNSETTKLIDISGYERHGTLSSAYGTIWQQASSPKEFLRFDGSSDECNLGDTLDDDGVSDFMIEAWVRIQGADGGLEQILGKKQASQNTAGYFLYRAQTTNKILFRIADGDSAVDIQSSSAVLQNVWKHIAIAIDRNGNGQLYINGADDGSPASVASQTTAQNAHNFLLAAEADGTHGQVDIGSVRFHNFGAGGIPSNIGGIVSNHFNAERGAYGV